MPSCWDDVEVRVTQPLLNPSYLSLKSKKKMISLSGFDEDLLRFLIDWTDSWISHWQVVFGTAGVVWKQVPIVHIGEVFVFVYFCTEKGWGNRDASKPRNMFVRYLNSCTHCMCELYVWTEFCLSYKSLNKATVLALDSLLSKSSIKAVIESIWQ